MCITKRLSLVSALVVWSSVVNSKSIPEASNASVLVSDYPKVAHWGSARSVKGQIPWTQRSDASVYYGQNLKNSGKTYDTSEVPAVGEIQERFNLRPYFQYELTPGSGVANKVESNKSPVQVSSPPDINYPVYVSTSAPVKALPVPLLPTVQPAPHEDPYTSSYTSYNPPQKESDTNDDHFDQASNSQEHETFNTDPEQTDINDSYLPQMNSAENNDKPPVFQPAKPTMNHDTFMDNDYAQMINFSPTQEKPTHEMHYQSHDDASLDESILDNPPAEYENKEPDMAAPPPPHHFRHYSPEEYSHDPHDLHHVYHEVEKPTEEKRVSKPQYSYYYIGRKLWYIPLYFSVYFIIYVTFLILKSIARHKIQFKHDFADHHQVRASRQLSDDNRIDNIHNEVTEALLQGKQNFQDS